MKMGASNVAAPLESCEAPAACCVSTSFASIGVLSVALERLVLASHINAHMINVAIAPPAKTQKMLRNTDGWVPMAASNVDVEANSHVM